MCFKPNPKHEDLQEEELEELEDNDFGSDFEGDSGDNENPEVEVMVEDESSLEYSNLLELPLSDPGEEGRGGGAGDGGLWTGEGFCRDGWSSSGS